MYHIRRRGLRFTGLFLIHWISGCHGSAFRQLQRCVKLPLSYTAQSHLRHRLSHSRQISDLSGYCELSESIHARSVGLEISFRSLILNRILTKAIYFDKMIIRNIQIVILSNKSFYSIYLINSCHKRFMFCILLLMDTTP